MAYQRYDQAISRKKIAQKSAGEVAGKTLFRQPKYRANSLQRPIDFVE
jgi:hypothetical protein